MARDALLSSGILHAAYERTGARRRTCGPHFLQAVGPVLSAPQTFPEWPGNEEKTRLVLIAKGLEPSDLGRSFDQYVLAPA